MFSSWDGFGDCQQSAEYAAEIGQKALGIADHGTVTGLINHYNECNKVGIKPILGVEGYFQPNFDKNEERYHIIVIAKNNKGYSNLMKLQTVATQDTFYHKPTFTYEQLETYNEGLIVSTACTQGYVGKMITDEKSDEHIINEISHFKEMFGDDYYLEVMSVDFPKQRKINEEIMRFSRLTKTKIIITNDSHYTSPEHYDTYKLMFKMRDKEANDIYKNRYMPTEVQLKDMWNKMHPNINIEPMIEMTEEIADKCNVKLEFDNMMPKQSWDKPADEKLRELAMAGLEDKEKVSDEYYNQLEFELNVIKSQSFENYFLLCYDIVDYAKSNGVRYGFGRGSVGGSLLAYSIGLTDVDPIVFGTDFERFMRKEKKKMPDIDMDFDANKRDKVIDYLTKKYAGKSAQISTFGYYKEKNLMNDLAKILEIPNDVRDAIKTELVIMIDGEQRPTIQKLKSNRILRKHDNEYHYLKHFQRLYNQTRFIGKHPAGIAITPDDITNYVALQKYRGTMQTAYDLDALEDLGVLKMDVLGLYTLSVISDIEKIANVEWKEEYLEDQNIYDYLSKGNTVGVFQFEKPGAIDVLQRVQPKNIQELIACNALNRPAPKNLGILDDYIDAKNGDIDNTNNPFYEFAKDSYGAIIFQEQVMRICRDVGGLSWDETDIVMKSLGEAEEIKSKFVDGAEESGLARDEASMMFDQMTAYLFNKGHGAAYSLTSFYTAWLKYYYPTEFFYALLKNENTDYKVTKYLAAAVQSDILILIAHVNGKADFSITKFEGEKAIQIGLKAVKGVGAKTANAIEKNGPYKNIEDLLEKNEKRIVNSGVVDALERDGALAFNNQTYWRRIIKYNGYLANVDISIH
jgi:DNA polymerase-3 subunit alpha